MLNKSHHPAQITNYKEVRNFDVIFLLEYLPRYATVERVVSLCGN